MNYFVRLRELREEKELTQQEVADIIKINRVQYNQYENDYNTIPLKHLIKLCDYFDVSLDYVFGFTDTRQYTDINKDLDIHLICERIKNFRKTNKITQEFLAKEFNISRTTITEYERGVNFVSTNFVYSLAKKYNISVDYLLGRIN